MELSVTVSGVLLDVLLATAAFPNPPLAQAESQPYPCGKEQQQVQRLLSGGFQAPRPPHVSTVPPGNHLTGLTPGALEVESLACHLTKFGDVVAATRPSGAGLLLPAASKSAEKSKTKAFKVAASVGGPAPPGGADGAPPSDSGGPRSAEPGAATAMTSASTATRIMAKRMAGWL
jgi:hypothetical protein